MNRRVKHDHIATYTLDDEENPGDIPVRLSWAPWDPYAVVIEFPAQRQNEPWAFSRELLEDGLFTSVGLGDVECESDGDSYWIILHGSHEQAGTVLTLKLQTVWVADFLDATVPDPGAFEVSLDSELEQLFREAA